MNPLKALGAAIERRRERRAGGAEEPQPEALSGPPPWIEDADVAAEEPLRRSPRSKRLAKRYFHPIIFDPDDPDGTGAA